MITLTAKPRIIRDSTYFILPSGKVSPGTYSVKKGTVINFNIAIYNENTSIVGSGGNVYVWLLNKKTGKSLWHDQFFMSGGGNYTNSGSIVVNEDVDLVFQTWYWDGSDWKYYDGYGDWKFNVGGGGSVSGSVHIDRKNTYVLINGKRYYPGTYTVNPSDNAVFHVECVNESGSKQFVCVILGDKATEGSDLTDKCGWMNSGERWKIDYSFVPAGVQGLYALAAWNGGKSKDKYCCWNFNAVKKQPCLRLMKGKGWTGLYVNKKWYGPGKYNVKYGTEINYVYAAKNYGGDGECKVVVMDVSTGEVIDSSEKYLKSGDWIGLTGNWLKATRNYEIKFIAYSKQNGKWVKTDEYGC